MEWTEFLKVHGPLAIGWILAGILIHFILSRYDKDIQSRVDLANALNALTTIIRERTHV